MLNWPLEATAVNFFYNPSRDARNYAYIIVLPETRWWIV